VPTYQVGGGRQSACTAVIPAAPAADFSLSETFGIQLGGRLAQKGVGLELDTEGVNVESRVLTASFLYR